MSERDGRNNGSQGRQDGGQRRNGRRGGRGGRPDRRQEGRGSGQVEARTVRREPQLPPLPPLPTPDCAICGKPILDIAGALAERESKQPAHFDCVMNALAEAERPGEGERLVYLGSGAFAVIEQAASGPRFTIKKRIQYEERDLKPDWRKELDRSIIR